VETIKEPMLEYGLAKHAHVGGGESGDLHMVCCNENGILIAVIDGIGHGEEAAEAARTAAALLQGSVDEPVISLVERCHERLKGTRGAVLSMAFISPEQKMMTWIGVGNVQGVLVRANAIRGNAQEPLSRGGTLFFSRRTGSKLIFPLRFPEERTRRGPPTGSSATIEAEMMTRWCWWRG
jgi:negative regulator of sigma-B (phosphoserine phosphatase)